MNWKIHIRAALAALLVGTVLALPAAADYLDDYVAQMREIEQNRKPKKYLMKELREADEILAKRFPERVYRSFEGVFYHVNYKKLGDKAWKVGGKPRKTEDVYDRRGPQITGQWSDGKPGSPPDQVLCVVVSFDLKQPVRIEELDREVDPSDHRALLGAYHELSMKGLAPVPEPAADEDPKKPSKARRAALAERRKCKEPKRRALGKVVKWSCVTQGLVEATGRRERREWHSWTDKERGATFVLFVRMHESALGNSKAMTRGATFAKAISDGG